MKKLFYMLPLFAATFAFSVGCDVDQVGEGELPDVDVEATEGEMPEYDVEGPDVDVTSEEEQVTVPDVDVEQEEKTIDVPDVDVDLPDDDEGATTDEAEAVEEVE